MQVSPFLAFAVAVEQAGQQLSAASYVPEWAGVGRRTPLFDVPRLHGLHVLALASLLPG